MSSPTYSFEQSVYDETQYFETNSSSCGSNSSGHRFIVTNTFEGIPETLALNVVGWLILLLLFAILRKNAWNYGRIAIQKPSDRWTNIFYGTGIENSPENCVEPTIDAGFCSWATTLFRTKDSYILARCGTDAIQYLSFQRHIIFYMAIIMLSSMLIVMPINLQGDLDGESSSFGATTMHNLPPGSPLLWVHATLSILYLLLGIAVMRKFSLEMKFTSKDSIVSRTVMISRVPKKYATVENMKQHFRESYPRFQVEDVQLVYDIRKISLLVKQREDVTQAKVFCEHYLEVEGSRLEMHPFVCGNVCSCCHVLCDRNTQVDALDYYKSKEHQLESQVLKERNKTLSEPLEIVFVTLSSIQEAEEVIKNHTTLMLCRCFCLHSPPKSSIRGLKPSRWRMMFSPLPEDICWENLSNHFGIWKVREFFINLVLFLILFFLTTPALVVNLLNEITNKEDLQRASPLLSDFLPTLLLLTVATLMPILVYHAENLIGHRTRSGQNHAIMVKTLTLLLFMVLILPSLGLPSAHAFLDWTFHGANETYRWDCLFLPDKGAFFVNYAITSAFIGTALELIRLPELFIYAIQLSLTRSSAEVNNVQKHAVSEFAFGVHYAWMLLIFAMTMTYSLACPLITPIGLLYMVLKHQVDRYNILFAYGPSKISPRIHATAINAVIISITLLQVSFASLAILRLGLNSIAKFSLASVALTCTFLLVQIVMQSCKGFTPISYQHRRSSSQNILAQSNSSTHQFVPSVLETSNEVHRNYGSTEADVVFTFESAASDAGDRVVLYQNYDDGSQI